MNNNSSHSNIFGSENYYTNPCSPDYYKYETSPVYCGENSIGISDNHNPQNRNIDFLPSNHSEISDFSTDQINNNINLDQLHKYSFNGYSTGNQMTKFESFLSFISFVVMIISPVISWYLSFFAFLLFFGGVTHLEFKYNKKETKSKIIGKIIFFGAFFCFLGSNAVEEGVKPEPFIMGLLLSLSFIGLWTYRVYQSIKSKIFNKKKKNLNKLKKLINNKKITYSNA